MAPHYWSLCCHSVRHTPFLRPPLISPPPFPLSYTLPPYSPYYPSPIPSPHPPIPPPPPLLYPPT